MVPFLTMIDLLGISFVEPFRRKYPFESRTPLTVIEPEKQGFMDACASIYGQYEDIWGAGVAAAIKELAK